MVLPLRSNAHLVQLKTALVLEEAVELGGIHYSSPSPTHPTSADRAEKQQVVKEEHTQALRHHSPFSAQSEQPRANQPPQRGKVGRKSIKLGLVITSPDHMNDHHLQQPTTIDLAQLKRRILLSGGITLRQFLLHTVHAHTIQNTTCQKTELFPTSGATTDAMKNSPDPPTARTLLAYCFRCNNRCTGTKTAHSLQITPFSVTHSNSGHARCSNCGRTRDRTDCTASSLRKAGARHSWSTTWCPNQGWCGPPQKAAE